MIINNVNANTGNIQIKGDKETDIVSNKMEDITENVL